MFVAARSASVSKMLSEGITATSTFVRAAETVAAAVQGCLKHTVDCTEEDVDVLQVDSELASKLECSIRPMKAGGFHIMAQHIPPQYLSLVPLRSGPCANVFRRWSGEAMELQPLPDASDALSDVCRRVAALLGVGVLQVRLSCGDAELKGRKLGHALQGSLADVSVSVQSASVYKDCIDKAKAQKGLIEKARVTFPKPTGIDINMMPFIMGDKSSLPKAYHQYLPMISECVTSQEEGKIGHLTIQESKVPAGESQRRPGLHLETPGVIMTRGRVVNIRLRWGGGFQDDNETVLGGLYTASTIANSCRAWDMRIDSPADVAGPLGEVDHLRESLGEGTFLKESTLYWMTDCTPHESVSLAKGAMRQYFRLVTSAVTGWYAKHSTENPLGVKPDPSITRILTHDKFADLASGGRDLVRDADEVWDIAAEEWGMETEENLVDQSLEAGKLLTFRELRS